MNSNNKIFDFNRTERNYVGRLQGVTAMLHDATYKVNEVIATMPDIAATMHNIMQILNDFMHICHDASAKLSDAIAKLNGVTAELSDAMQCLRDAMNCWKIYRKWFNEVMVRRERLNKRQQEVAMGKGFNIYSCGLVYETALVTILANRHFVQYNNKLC